MSDDLRDGRFVGWCMRCRPRRIVFVARDEAERDRLSALHDSVHHDGDDDALPRQTIWPKTHEVV